MLQIFELSRENGGMPMVHCESDPIAAMNDQRFTEAGRRSWKDFAEAKPVFCELEAFSRASTYARYAGCPLIIVHTTNKKCLDIARLCHEEGAPVYIETCPHYLTLSQDIYDTADGHMALCSPPLRPAEERDALWRGISDGTISLIGSDLFVKIKISGEDKRRRIDSGLHCGSGRNIRDGGAAESDVRRGF